MRLTCTCFNYANKTTSDSDPQYILEINDMYAIMFFIAIYAQFEYTSEELIESLFKIIVEKVKYWHAHDKIITLSN